MVGIHRVAPTGFVFVLVVCPWAPAHGCLLSSPMGTSLSFICRQAHTLAWQSNATLRGFWLVISSRLVWSVDQHNLQAVAQLDHICTFGDNEVVFAARYSSQYLITICIENLYGVAFGGNNHNTAVLDIDSTESLRVLALVLYGICTLILCSVRCIRLLGLCSARCILFLLIRVNKSAYVA